MKLVSWNVNGLRACVRKGFTDYFHEIDADVFCLQEIKLQEGQIDLSLEGYEQYWNYAEKKGYSGTAVFTKRRPLSIIRGIHGEEDPEGRVLTLEYEEFYLVNCYTPNSRRDLSRLSLRLKWEDDLYAYLNDLDTEKPVIYCGDLNVAHQEIDIRNVRSNIGNSGFTDEEREKMSRLLRSGFTDSYRYLYPAKQDSYTWWSYLKDVRARNIGWRIDYVIISDRLTPRLVDSQIHSDIFGSDHCPVAAIFDFGSC